MTTTTYGTHGYVTDCEDITGWTENRVGMIDADATLETIYDDYFKIKAIFDQNAEEYVYYEKDITNISTDTNPTVYVRWKTSAASNGAGARVKIVYSDASEDFIVGIANPEYSTTWKITSGTLDASKLVDKIQVSADNWPNTSACNGTHYVYYDFIMITKKPFTFPNRGTHLTFHPPMRYATIPIPGRWGDVLQNLGYPSATWNITCDLNVGNWKRTTAAGYWYNDYRDGQVFMDITPWDTFQVLDTEREMCKVVLDDLTFNQEPDNPTIDLLFREYRRSGANSLPEDYQERFGLDL